MKKAVFLQPAAVSYAESLLKFAFSLNKEVQWGLKSELYVSFKSFPYSDDRATFLHIYFQ